MFWSSTEFSEFFLVFDIVIFVVLTFSLLDYTTFDLVLKFFVAILNKLCQSFHLKGTSTVRFNSFRMLSQYILLYKKAILFGANLFIILRPAGSERCPGFRRLSPGQPGLRFPAWGSCSARSTGRLSRTGLSLPQEIHPDPGDRVFLYVCPEKERMK